DSVKPEPADGGVVWTKYSFSGGQVQVRLVMLVPPGQSPDKAKGGRLEILKTGKNPETIMTKADMALMVPSPNGELVAVRSFAQGQGKDGQNESRILIINKKGEILADVPVQN